MLSILTYHSIDDSGSVISISPTLFARQMGMLAKKGYTVLALSDAATRLRSGSDIPERSVVLTFDDGYRNVYTEAFPVLQRHGFTATVFLIAEYCGGFNDWPGHESPVGRRPLLRWTEIEEMYRHGIEFGAHTLTHPTLTGLPRAAAEREIVQSQAALQDRLGAPVDTFAYPYGRFNGQHRETARHHFLCACSTRLGRATASSDMHALPRIDIFYLKSPLLFRRLFHPLLAPYLRFRQFLRDLRHA